MPDAALRMPDSLAAFWQLQQSLLIALIIGRGLRPQRSTGALGSTGPLKTPGSSRPPAGGPGEAQQWEVVQLGFKVIIA